MKDEDYAFEQRRQAQIDEDYAFEQRCQAQIDAENSTNWPQWHQKVGTVIPFSRTVDRDPNPRIPLSVPEDSYPRINKKEAVFWLFVGAALIAWWTGVL